jgi:uncharacterized membrane protein YdjX (TVP38/TMEM64 family)
MSDTSDKKSAKQQGQQQASTKSFIKTLQELTSKPMPRSMIAALAIALVISAASIVIMQAFDGAIKMRVWIESAGAWAPLVYIALKAATYVVAPLSGTPVKLAGGVLFGFWEGFALGMIGDTVGASMNFWIARLFRDRGINRIAGRNAIKRINELTEHVGGWRALLAARLVLSSLYDFISYAAGISSLRFREFFLVTVIAGIPASLWAAWLGNTAATNSSFLYVAFAGSALALLVIFIQSKLATNKIPRASAKDSLVDTEK